MTNQTFPAFKEHGFTLVELIAALAIFLVVVLILVSIINSISNVWQQGIAHNDRRSAALAVFERMSQDLRLTAQTSDLSGPALQMVINPATLVTGSYTLPQAIFWQAPVAASGTSGDLAVVGYFVQWVGNTPKLCRLLIDPSSSAYSVYASGTTPWTYSGTSFWSSSITDALLSGSNGAPASQAAGYQGQVAENVLGLWVQALDQKMAPIVTMAGTSGSFTAGRFDSTQGYISSAAYTSGTTVTTGTMIYPSNTTLQSGTWSVSSPPLCILVNDSGTNTYQTPPSDPATAGNGSLPAAIEVAIVTVDGRTALKLSGTEKPASSTGNLWNDVNTFYNALPPSIRNGAEIHSTIINLTDSPR